MPVHDWTRVIPGTFHHFHHDWISAISRALNSGILPAEFYAMAEQIAGGLGPDVLTLGGPDGRNGESDFGGGTALATAVPKTRYSASVERDLYAMRRKQVVIRHRSGDEVIAIVEIVSPGNKSSQYSLDRFVDKTLEILASGIHMLIIDLIPPGPRDPKGIHGVIMEKFGRDEEYQPPPDEPLTLSAYSSGDELWMGAEPVAVGQPLPDMPLFLFPHRHVSVPLEATYQSAFEGVPQRWRRELE